MSMNGDERPEFLLELRHVFRQFVGPNDTQRVDVLRDVSLQVAAGDSVAVIGPSGSGKSTLLNIIGGLDRPSSGTVLLDGRDLSTLSDADLAEVRRSDVGFIFQLHHLLPQCTVIENVLLPTLADGRARAPDEACSRAVELLERVGLAHRMHHRPGQLSGGERQRAAVVRALINRPRLLLADEPTGSLDQAAADELAQLLVDLNREQGTLLVLVTHSVPLAKRMNRLLELRDGRLTPESAGHVAVAADDGPETSVDAAGTTGSS